MQSMIHGSLDLNLGATKAQLLIGVAAIILMEVIHVLQYKVNIFDWIRQRPLVVRWGIYYVVFFMILFFGVYENREFIYFQF
jgi:hypothetical protein